MNIKTKNQNLQADLNTLEYLLESNFFFGTLFYKQLAKKYHPDVNPRGLKAMKLINSIYNYFKKINKVNL